MLSYKFWDENHFTPAWYNRNARRWKPNENAFFSTSSHNFSWNFLLHPSSSTLPHSTNLTKKTLGYMGKATWKLPKDTFAWVKFACKAPNLIYIGCLLANGVNTWNTTLENSQPLRIEKYTCINYHHAPLWYLQNGRYYTLNF